MQSRDLSGFSLRSTGQHSRLLSEDSFLPSEQDDLSLSDLSLSDRAYNPKPFSLLAQPKSAPSSSKDDRPVTPENTHPPEDDDDGEGTPRDHDRDDDRNDDDDLDTPEAQERRAKQAARAREEKLQNDLFILRKMNASFAVLNDALRETQSGAQRVEEQLAQTETLLNKYANLLAKSERVSKLLLDERWQGASVDEEIILREQREAEEAKRRLEEERAREAQRRKELLEQEEQERQEREERERREKERKERGPTYAVRGVRGTRASMRGAAAARASVVGRGASTTGTKSSTSSQERPDSRLKRPTAGATASSSIRRTTSTTSRGGTR